MRRSGPPPLRRSTPSASVRFSRYPSFSSRSRAPPAVVAARIPDDYRKEGAIALTRLRRLGALVSLSLLVAGVGAGAAWADPPNLHGTDRVKGLRGPQPKVTICHQAGPHGKVVVIHQRPCPGRARDGGAVSRACRHHAGAPDTPHPTRRFGAGCREIGCGDPDASGSTTWGSTAGGSGGGPDSGQGPGLHRNQHHRRTRTDRARAADGRGRAVPAQPPLPVLGGAASPPHGGDQAHVAEQRAARGRVAWAGVDRARDSAGRR